jgi:hypothetical protein
MKYSLSALVALAVPSVALAQKEAAIPEVPWLAVAGICPLLALLVGLLVLMLVVLRRSGAMRQGEYLANAAEHIERASAHMDRQEEREVRIIELLESIERELKRNGGSEGIKKV